jgi:hypothetical protein
MSTTDVAVATDSAQREADRYTLSFTELQRQKDRLQKSLDLMTSAKGLYSNVSDDLHYSVDEFTKNIGSFRTKSI